MADSTRHLSEANEQHATAGCTVHILPGGYTMILVVSMNLPSERAAGQSPTEPKCRFEDLTGSPVLVQHFTQVTPELVKAAGIKAIFIMGSAARWPDFDPADFTGLYRTVMEVDVPIHGACFGHQVLGVFFNGDFPWTGVPATLKRMRELGPNEPDTNPGGNYPGWFFERGVCPVQILADDPVFEAIPSPALLSEAHYWEVTKLPPDFIHLARTDECEITVHAPYAQTCLRDTVPPGGLVRSVPAREAVHDQLLPPGRRHGLIARRGTGRKLMPRIATLQTTCVVGDVEANVSQALLMLEQAGKAGADLAVLPECFATGIGEHLAETAEPISGPSADRLCEAADAHDMWIVAGMAEKTRAGIANTALVIAPGGEIRARYHKRFLYMQEADAFIRGDEGLVVDMGFVNAGIAICYDYVFPEYIRALVDNGAQLIIHPTAWVTTEIGEQWHYDAAECYRAQCRVRALENGVYFISANHGGEAYDAGGYLRPVGNSCVIAPWGQVLGGMGLGPGIAVVEVDFDAIDGWAAAAAPYLHDYQTVPVPPVSRV